MSRPDLWTGVAALTLSATVFALTINFPVSTAEQLGPAFFPRLLAVGLAVLGLFVLGASFGADGPRAERGRPGRRRLPALLVLLLVLSTAALEPFGFLLSAVGFLFVAMRIFGTPIRRAAWTAILVAAVTFVLFKLVLRIQLPVGSIWG